MKKSIILTILIYAIALFYTSSHAENNPQPHPTWRFDHVVITVNNLAQASADFIKLGFTVLPDTTSHSQFYQKVSIPLSDGTYIELLAPATPQVADELKKLKNQNKLDTITNELDAVEARYINQLAKGEGLADFALSTTRLDLNDTIVDLDDNSLDLLGPIPMKSYANGKLATWEVAVPVSNDFPILISDSTSRNNRISWGKIPLQKNGVNGIASITIVVDDLDSVKQDYEKLLGTEPLKNSRYAPPNNVKIAVFKLGYTDIILAQPTDEDSPLRYQLTKQGNSIYHIAFRTVEKSKDGKLDPTLTHNTNIKLVYE